MDFLNFNYFGLFEWFSLVRAGYKPNIWLAFNFTSSIDFVALQFSRTWTPKKKINKHFNLNLNVAQNEKWKSEICKWSVVFSNGR